MNKRTKLKILLILMVFLTVSLITGNSYSQGLTGTLVLNNPSPYLSDWETKASTAILTVTNSKVNINKLGMPVKSEVVLKKDGKDVSGKVPGKINYIPAPAKQNAPPVTTTFTSDKIADWKNVKLEGPIYESAKRTGRLPEGSYEVCVYIKETGDINPATLTVCATFNINLPQAPRLVSPIDKKQVIEISPTFSWIIGGQLPEPSNLQIKIRFFNVLKNQTPVQAFNNPSQLFHQETTPFKYSYQYPISAPKFIEDNTYAWQVQLLDKNGNGYGENDGKSEIWGFTKTKTGIVMDTGKIPAPTKLIMADFEIIVDKSKWKKQQGSNKYEGEGTTKFKSDSKTIPVKFSYITIPQGQIGTITPTEGVAICNTQMEIKIFSNFNLIMDSLIITPSYAVTGGNVKFVKGIIDANGKKYAKFILPYPSKINVNGEILNTDVINKPYAFYIGETSIEVTGNSYSISILSSVPEGKRGIRIPNGQTEVQNDITSNRGYLKAKYKFSDNITVENTGVSGTLYINSDYTFTSTEPYGYKIKLINNKGYLKLSSSTIIEGKFTDAEITLPENAVSSQLNQKSAIKVIVPELKVQPDIDLFAKDFNVNSDIYWGELSLNENKKSYYQIKPTQGSKSIFYLPARKSDTTYVGIKFTNEGEVFRDPFWGDVNNLEMQVEKEGVKGLTTYSYEGKWTFIIHSTDNYSENDPPVFKSDGWINIFSMGVNADIAITSDVKSPNPTVFKIGNISKSYYKSEGEPFYIFLKDHDCDKENEFVAIPEYKEPSFNECLYFNRSNFLIKFVNSSLWDDNFSGEVKLDRPPINTNFRFKNLMLTSTANFAGAVLDLSDCPTLEHWGVQLCPADPNNISGIVCPKNGLIYLTGARLREDVHFDLDIQDEYKKGFLISWGEIKADRNIKELKFDYGDIASPRHSFDNFTLTPNFLGLSEYIEGFSGSFGAFYAYGMVAVKFFGGKIMSIEDWRHNRQDSRDGRFARVTSVPSNAIKQGLTALGRTAINSQLTWEKTWGNNNKFVFEMQYDTAGNRNENEDTDLGKGQFGFFGNGTVDLQWFTVDNLPATIITKYREEYIKHNENENYNITNNEIYSIIKPELSGFNKSLDFNMAGISIGALSNFFGKGIAVGDKLDSLWIFGNLIAKQNAGSDMFFPNSNQDCKLRFTYIPQGTTLNADLKVKLNGFLGTNLFTFDGTGKFSDITNNNESKVIGDIFGKVNGSSIGFTARGQIGWVFGNNDIWCIQARATIEMHGFSAEGAFFVSNNLDPVDETVLSSYKGNNGKFNISKEKINGWTNSNNRLTGLYALADFTVLSIGIANANLIAGIGFFEGKDDLIVVPIRIGIRARAELDFGIVAGRIDAWAIGDGINSIPLNDHPFSNLSNLFPKINLDVGIEVCGEVCWIEVCMGGSMGVIFRLYPWEFDIDL
jgi:hypothetical protein